MKRSVFGQLKKHGRKDRKKDVGFFPDISVEREIRQADEELPKEWKNGQAEEEKSSGTEAPGSDQARCHQSPTCDERRA